MAFDVKYQLFVGEGENPDFESQVEEHDDAEALASFAANLFATGMPDEPSLEVAIKLFADGTESEIFGPSAFNDATNYAMQLALADKHLKLAGKPGLTP